MQPTQQPNNFGGPNSQQGSGINIFGGNTQQNTSSGQSSGINTFTSQPSGTNPFGSGVNTNTNGSGINIIGGNTNPFGSGINTNMNTSGINTNMNTSGINTNMNASGINTTGGGTSPFGSGISTTGGGTNPFGSGINTTGGINTNMNAGGINTTGGNTNPFGSGINTTGGGASPFGSGINTTGGDTNPFGSGINTSMNASMNNNLNTGTPIDNTPKDTSFNTFSNTEANKDAGFTSNNGNSLDQGRLVSSINDNTVSLYNLKLQEIIEMQASILDKNIKKFRKDAQSIFEQDMKLIKAKNNYMSLQPVIEKEKALMDELDGLLEYCDKYIDGLPQGEFTEMGRCCEEFENICDKFYKSVEGVQDEHDEVLDILNNNYELIELIDYKMDYIEKH